VQALKDLTPEQQESLDKLRAALPPIHTDYKALSSELFAAERVIDLEWHTVAKDDDDEEDKCSCGRDLPEGTLETIGIGNDKAVLQVDWLALTPSQCIEMRQNMAALIATGVTIYHNAPADIKKMREYGFEVSGEAHARLEDTMLADSVLHSEEFHGLGELNRRLGRLPDYKHLKRVAPSEYNAGDLVGTYLIWKYGLEPQLQKDPRAAFVYRHMSIPFIDIAIEGEEAGIHVNPKVAWELHEKYSMRVAQGRMLARAWTGNAKFNLGSPDDMKHWLYNVYRFPVQRERSFNDEPGKWKSDKDALSALRRMLGTEWDEDDEPSLEQAVENIEDGGNGILEAKFLFGGAQQRLTHYVKHCFELDELGQPLAPKALIHPRCKIHGQAAGRVGWVKPALPQMRGETAKLITPPTGFVWVGHDWSNIETWLLAGLAGDEPLLRAKIANWDTHVVNFCDMTGTPYPPLLTKALHTSPMCADWRALLDWQGDEDLRRTFAKRFVYRLHYRGKAENAGDIPGAKALKFDTDRLISASELYLKKHPAIVEFWNQIEAQADRYRVVYTFMGRPRRLTSEWRNARNREASNHPMQGGVADIWITTVLLVRKAAPWARLVYGAYDSMWWQVPIERQLEFTMIYAPIVERVFNVAGREMNFPASFKVKEAA